MYLTIKQHDLFRTLLMGFEIPYRVYISRIITAAYPSAADFESAMATKNTLLTPSSPQFLKDILPDACRKHTLSRAYQRFQTATSSTDPIITEDIELPMVGALNLATFALVENFADLHSLFNTYNVFCDQAELYRYCRNKLDHPGCRTLEDAHLVPVLSFVKNICYFLDDSCFLQKSREQLLSELVALQQRKQVIPVDIHNFAEMPYGDQRIVCRDKEIQRLKNFVYGKPEDLRKQHSLCVYGYGGVGKTALVLETMKQIVRDIQDQTTTGEYEPKYMLFFSAKKRKLTLASETGRFLEQQLRYHFETADELITLILSTLQVESLRKYHEEGLIVVDNLETLSLEERQKVKTFVETQTPSEMQFILTSRNSEDYETNYKLAGFDSDAGTIFIKEYIAENSLIITLSEQEITQLLLLAKGNTLVLVLSLRRLSENLSTIGALQSEFTSQNAWKSLRSSLAKTPSNAYEVIGEFMYKDTFEHIESAFADNAELFYKVLKVFAVIQGESTDITTICLLTGENYPDVEAAVDILCNYLILEKNDTQLSLNGFAEKYIVGRFIPDAETYNKLSSEIAKRQRQVKMDLDQLRQDMADRPSLAKIMRDWLIVSDIDRITAAKMYRLYGNVKDVCEHGGKFQIHGTFDEFLQKCAEAESMTAHPFVKYQKARILQLVDNSNRLPQKHTAEIKKGFHDAIYAINTLDQYSGIQQTKSFASLLWLFGQYLSDVNELQPAIRYLEESKASFEEQNISDQEYFQCTTKLGHAYLDFYLEDRTNRLTYLRRSRDIARVLSQRWDEIDKARSHVGDLRARLRSYGQY